MGNFMTLLRGEIPTMTEDECTAYNTYGDADETGARAPVIWEDEACKRFTKKTLITINSCTDEQEYNFNSEECVAKEGFINKNNQSLIILIIYFILFIMINKRFK